ncbi:farnesyl-diphosphate farnesyltransferase [Cladophialophora bantiana CBS 173.52]|uniref:squalene synthase n=1 Tax=Cladophialophora bantiana (strain ATCC 10958 / CBS 173.52 / CDC B-1940 / NIH 8579) TaxID=1442370 RepID=A0A0D2IPS6_CLAB1|nr:farnesyl-diphosphate farnesyltransferase [Cladophialophora bantiana CBS 173.52]KIW98814.1 farnesyl-diphosphate farnesyltransferase [Cladophialophora bantiana CBS 173.52]
MVKASEVVFYLFHPQQLRSIIQWKVWHNPVHERDESKETESAKQCFKYLKMTSRSFSAVIQELHPELLLPVTLFYLVLRGLDTIEDDTSIPVKKKEPVLRNFDEVLEIDGWTYTENRPEEKDRELLLNYGCVVEEFKKIRPAYQVIIKDIAKRMGNGMADYCAKSENNDFAVVTCAEYDQYCYYVAGLVGEGLTRMFVESKFGNPVLLDRPNLHNSMGIFLQKTNIIRDVREDFDDHRIFWPKEIWSRHVDKFEDLFKPEYKEQALNCSAEMVLNALNHADECIFYMAGLREQSVFNFCAIPQTMAIATLDLCFRNYSMFQRNIKITKGEACQIMIESTQNLQVACEVFRRHIHSIRKKNRPQDPNFLKISIACGKVEQFIESIFPSQKVEDVLARNKADEARAELAKREKEAGSAGAKDTLALLGAVVLMLLFITATMVGVAWLMGARFDVAFEELKKSWGQILTGDVFKGPSQNGTSTGTDGHSEL